MIGLNRSSFGDEVCNDRSKFCGTGNTKFCVDKFLKEYDHSENVFSIEDNRTLKEIENHNEIVIGYPVQYSNIPKILRDYIVDNQHIWRGKNM